MCTDAMASTSLLISSIFIVLLGSLSASAIIIVIIGVYSPNTNCLFVEMAWYEATIRVSIFFGLFFEKFDKNSQIFKKMSINSIKTKEISFFHRFGLISEFGNDYKTAY
jgi:hypothetical protein